MPCSRNNLLTPSRHLLQWKGTRIEGHGQKEWETPAPRRRKQRESVNIESSPQEHVIKAKASSQRNVLKMHPLVCGYHELDGWSRLGDLLVSHSKLKGPSISIPDCPSSSQAVENPLKNPPLGVHNQLWRLEQMIDLKDFDKILSQGLSRAWSTHCGPLFYQLWWLLSAFHCQHLCCYELRKKSIVLLSYWRRIPCLVFAKQYDIVVPTDATTGTRRFPKWDEVPRSIGHSRKSVLSVRSWKTSQQNSAVEGQKLFR